MTLWKTIPKILKWSVVLEGGQNSCNQCNQQVITETILKAHKEVVHEGVKFLADQCDYHS